MKCKNCGGELLYKNGIYLCNSCGAAFSLDGVYENIDVCICYEESDSAGRRTRDSVIAQEVYRKLEESKIATFYERVSADGMAGDELETCKTVAINKAKIVIVLGTSVETFTTIQEKYTDYLNDKTVIPFCVDINPGVIPKTLSKIQAMSYSTIGWDKDLIKGIFNILGREQSVDTSLLYNRRRNKIIIVCISVVVVIAIAVTGWFILKPKDATDNASSTNETSAPETKPMSQKEIYDTANGLLDQGDFIGALQLFYQIPDHPNSANLIKQIYSKYEGYYNNENTVVHIEIVDNIRAELEINTTNDGKVVRIATSAQIDSNISNLKYEDNHNNVGEIKLELENTGIKLKITNTTKNIDTDLFFLTTEKSDQPIIKIDSSTLFNWLKEKPSLEEVLGFGYELDFIFRMNNAGSANLYRIKNTEIYLSMVGDELYGVAAPAELITPSKIGNRSELFAEGDLIYCPNYFLGEDGGLFMYMPISWVIDSDSEGKDEKITNSTIIGVTYSKYLSDISWYM